MAAWGGGVYGRSSTERALGLAAPRPLAGSGARCATLAALLGALAACLLWWALTSPASRTASSIVPEGTSAQSLGSGLAELPAGARGAVSAALGSVRPRYRLAALPGAFVGENPAQHLRLRFTGTGAHISRGALSL